MASLFPDDEPTAFTPSPAPGPDAPLAERQRPRRLADYAGQQHLIGPEGVLRRYLNAGRLPSLILWGPPGVGKTTLAYLLASELKQPFVALSAINAGVKDVRDVIEKAKRQRGTVLFIDEIHRFSKAQQDALLGAVEHGTVTLIGATTENPSFEVIPALLSRCQVYMLEALSAETLRGLVDKALSEDAAMQQKKVSLKEDRALLALSGGDARKLLNLLEIVVQSTPPTKKGVVEITDAVVQQVAQRPLAKYDKGGEMHYDVISAFIKSIRGSDPNAALYYLAVMLEGGEDVKFIARRMLILASEDIGNANPNALMLATSCFQACTVIGLPESDLILAQTVIYLATSVKSNASYLAIRAAQAEVKAHGVHPVPVPLRNAPTRLMKQLGYGKEYAYSHNGEGNFEEQEFLPEALSGKRFYDPGLNPSEAKIQERLRGWWGEKYGY
ncbi:replication-associated recombination protein A [Hymenobacter properus]|uniref:Replication-associated recombination protein A n=1 Tax=Hymenobacter properus TaxID=2791026 RepID=A0A931FKX3_9BACT|nr:replication-associated recombination protein A [Hymenobacter properus]MBF9140159.1 replication-associated recombination protein A [Hymenobacter properus]MBR7718966.1 replication-associated recombination protein A [Microvirga sp. SRT04]